SKNFDGLPFDNRQSVDSDSADRAPTIVLRFKFELRRGNDSSPILPTSSVRCPSLIDSSTPTLTIRVFLLSPIFLRFTVQD
ncbi:hypothetical protein LINPERHAP1_LOCUS1444, partial [Linum perenne]